MQFSSPTGLASDGQAEAREQARESTLCSSLRGEVQARTGQPCNAPAMRGKERCRIHGGKSTGPKTIEGRRKCCDAKVTHGKQAKYTYTERMKMAKSLEELRAIEMEIRGIKVEVVQQAPKAKKRTWEEAFAASVNRLFKRYDM